MPLQTSKDVSVEQLPYDFVCVLRSTENYLAGLSPDNFAIYKADIDNVVRNVKDGVLKPSTGIVALNILAVDMSDLDMNIFRRRIG